MFHRFDSQLPQHQHCRVQAAFVVGPFQGCRAISSLVEDYMKLTYEVRQIIKRILSTRITVVKSEFNCIALSMKTSQ